MRLFLINLLKKMSDYILLLIAIALTVFFAFQLWRVDFSYPFIYTWDGLFSAFTVKNIGDNGWIYENQFTGAPFLSKMYDYPTFENINFFLIKVLVLFFDSWAVVINIFYMLGFFLIGVTALYALKRMHIPKYIAVVGALLYTCLPYHFMKGEQHLFLSGYFMIPLITLLCMNIIKGRQLFYQDKGISVSKLGWVSLLVCVVTGMTGIYYAFFACFFIIVGCAIVVLNHNHRSVTLVLDGVVSVCIVIGSLIVNVMPNVFFWLKNGRPTVLQMRGVSESEYFGLKIAQLLLPSHDHRIPLFSTIASDYYSNSILNGEGSATLGVTMSIGFLVLLLGIFISKASGDYMQSLGVLSQLNIAAVLLATIGGFGNIFALIVSSIRGYNRISVFIAFFSISCVCLVLGKLYNVYFKRKRVVFAMGLILLMLVGLYDQIYPSFVPNYDAIRQEYDSDELFVSTVEASIPANSMIFQLPYVPFPENPPVNNMSDYSLFRGYLFSETVRWSYGNMKGSFEDRWMENVSTKPIHEMLQVISIVDFAGIYVDSYGYTEDDSERINSELISLLHVKPMVSNNGRLYFYDMESYNNQTKQLYSMNELEKLRWDTLHPIMHIWGGSFAHMETGDNNQTNWRWCGESGYIDFESNDVSVRNVTISFTPLTGYSEMSHLLVSGCGVSEDLLVNQQSNDLIVMQLEIKPGHNRLSFQCDAKRVVAPNDPRQLVFRLESVIIQ